MPDQANFMLLDAAIMGPAMCEARSRNPANRSLFQGAPRESLDGVAPFLFRYTPASKFAAWLHSEGDGRAWGIFIKSPWPMPELLRHLQRLLRVKSDEGQHFLFRYYDPRILRVFLPSCDAKQLREFFGENHIEYCIAEDEDPEFALRFRLENGKLRTERFAVAEQTGSQSRRSDATPGPDDRQSMPETAGPAAAWKMFGQ